MRKRNEPKPIQGWGWLGDAAEEAAVQTIAPVRRLKNRSTTVAVKGKDRNAVTQLSDDEYRRLAKQQYQSKGKIEIDPHGRVSRSEGQTGEVGAWVQAWVFVGKSERR
jgi:hypothetical protein